MWVPPRTDKSLRKSPVNCYQLLNSQEEIKIKMNGKILLKFGRYWATLWNFNTTHFGACRWNPGKTIITEARDDGWAFLPDSALPNLCSARLREDYRSSHRPCLSKSRLLWICFWNIHCLLIFFSPWGTAIAFLFVLCESWEFSSVTNRL